MERNNVRPLELRTCARVDPTNSTQQAMKDACDVNLIMKQYEKTGTLVHQNLNKPAYGDFSNVSDYLQARNEIMAAEAGFGRLPSGIRRRFNNNPEELLNFIDNPENLEEAVSLGLVDDPNPESKRPSVANPPKEPDPAPEPAPEPSKIPANPSPVAGGA